MSKKVFSEGDEGVRLVIKDAEEEPAKPSGRAPVHVVYGGADRYTNDVGKKIGRIALDSLKIYAPNFAEFARVFELTGHDELPLSRRGIRALEKDLKSTGGHEHLAYDVYRKTVDKLRREAVEDFRIDFEDGYGFRAEAEEDGHASAAAGELAKAFSRNRITPFSGFRIKSFGQETYGRAIRTLEIFLNAFFKSTGGRVPENFCVTLPKITDQKQVRELAKELSVIEKKHGISKGIIGVELMIETPESIVDKKGRIAVRGLIDAARGRCSSVHFGAYDYTSALGISASHQNVRHPACSAARYIIQLALAGTDVRLVDSVTTLMPVPVHRAEELSDAQQDENRRAVHVGWLRHFRNVSASMTDGIYQGWDLHPNQLVARYAAVYSFFRAERDAQAERLRAFLERATKATMTGNTFDDAASANGLLNFFRRGRDCGAFDLGEINEMLGIAADDLDHSFSQLIKAG